MDIQAGDKILLELSTFEDRFLGVVTEVKGDGRLLVYASVPERVVTRVKVHAVALVRYAHDGRLLGFSSRVLNEFDSTNALLELAGPDTVFDAEDRREPRCSCRFPAIIVSGDKAVNGVIEDMSASCARVRVFNDGLIRFPEEPGRKVNLTFHSFDMEGDGYSVGCSVLKSFLKNNERFVVLEFSADEPDARSRISGFVEAQVCCCIPQSRF